MLNEVSELVSRETSKEKIRKPKIDNPAGANVNVNANVQLDAHPPPLFFSETPKKIAQAKKDLPLNNVNLVSGFDSSLQTSVNSAI